ncbi:similar to Saccharomyces cerevisiae YDR443C SSN2 Subunit of the RNA polymerase II mediator complex [Maudiozyma saulgeensis]|uniref:Mediator of RNA polymerase II transcription subunit 13 n=1 Tax=Maudiozyma saulgeensis TaxID=1789683 RepID=A0A1X7R5U4_9SACH|nr:similar to Saccharomyces cerevisiae YDR443C SSN2 Subunit of the RNA polymerase II mediator complex [Kazachstania saulgeensis]
MDPTPIHYRLEDVFSSFYKINTIQKINYEQYIPKNQDERWSIQMELQLRKQDPKTLVALLSKELWRFSINDDTIPPLPLGDNNENSITTVDSNISENDEKSIITPEKTGEFTADYSKPNLPPYYALFLKALRKSIYINLALNSNNTLVQFGNACIPLNNENNDKNFLLQIEPHLFSNSDLALSICVKNLEFSQLKEESLNSSYLRSHALYMAPSGIRAYIKTTTKQKYLVSPPNNADILLDTLFTSHGINLKGKKNMKWISLIPHLGHLNGQTPSVGSYMIPPSETRSITWPLDLCLVQSSFDNVSGKMDAVSSDDFQNAIDMIDDFIQIKQTSAYRTPGSSGAMGTNPMSTGGPYTEQLQPINKKSVSSVNGNLGLSPLGGTQSTLRNTGVLDAGNNLLSNSRGISPQYSTIERLAPNPADAFTGEFSTTPINNENNNNQLFNDRKHDLRMNPLKMDTDKPMTIMDDVLDDNNGDNKELFGDDDEDMIDPKDKIIGSVTQDKNLPSNPISDDDEDLFGETSEEDSKPLVSKLTSDEITEDMFGMSDDEEGNNRSSTKNTGKSKDISSDSFPEINEAFETPKKQNLKRKYLDIPIDEMTLSNSPLYMDPGAPLPVETPRERRKSVFAPLTFNPKIENNVDNKYKNGGKFSFSPSQKEEALKFDVSNGEISSSEEEDSDSSLDSFDYPNIKNDLRSLDGNINDQPYSQLTTTQDNLPTGLLSGVFNGSSELYNNREGSNSIWRLPPSEIPQTDSPLKSIEASIPSPLEGSNQSDNFGKVLNVGNFKENESSASRNVSDSSKPFNSSTSDSGNDSSTSESFTTIKQHTSSNIPFLLRHMPLSSIPDVFLYKNPTVTININDPDILNQLCEQIVFDYSLLKNFGLPNHEYQGVNIEPNGLVSKTLSSLFNNFEQIAGNTLINKIFPIKEPFVFVKKQDELIKVRSCVQEYVKFLNFKAPFGIKNFKFLLLTNSFKNDCLSFVSTLSQTYISQEFGFCELLKLSDEDANGLINVKDYEKTKLLLLAAQIVSYCSTNKNSGNDANLMIILPLESADIYEFVLKTQIFQLIRCEVRSKIPNLDLYFKLIPMEMIKNPLTSVDSYYNLCASIYNILPSKKVKYTTIAHKLPGTVTFRTMKAPHGSSVIHYDVYIHLAYSRSVDKQWIFAALSDSDGNENMIKSWFVGDSRIAFDNACNEIWSMALSLASLQFGKICLILTRLDGILPDDELMNWRRLSGRNVHLAVVCVDDSEKISFFDEDKLYPNFKPIFKNNDLSGRINPQNINDYEIRNLDEDIHGVIFEHPFPLANSQHRCAIKSGALVKFKRNSGNSTWKKFEVNLLNCPHSDSTKLLETILEEFRNLAALNLWFGVSNGEKSHIPWHVLAVKKMMNVMVHTRIEIENGNK